MNNKQILAAMQDVCGASSIYVKCCCGRVHFNSDIGHDDDKDTPSFEELMQRQMEDPDRYFPSPTDATIPFIHFDGKEIVAGCPCKEDLLVGKMLWDNRYLIAKLFESLNEAQQKTALSAACVTERVQQAVDV